MRFASFGPLALFLIIHAWIAAGWGQGVAGTALVRHAPTVIGTVDGSVHQMLPESVTLSGGARVTRDLLVPGFRRFG